MAAVETMAMADALPHKDRAFRKYSYRGVELDSLLDLSNKELVSLLGAKERRRLERGAGGWREAQEGGAKWGLTRNLRDAKLAAAPGERPGVVRTHVRDAVVLPEMIGSVVGVHNGKAFVEVEIKPEMVGHKLGEFALTYKLVKHGKPGIGGTRGSMFTGLK